MINRIETTMKTDVVFDTANNILDLGYARKSQEDPDKQVTSNEDQIQIIKSNATSKFNVTIPDSNIFSDSKTGQTAGVRPGFNLMRQTINYAIKKGFKVRLHLWDVKRAGRNGEEGGYLTDLVKNGHLEIITDIAGNFDQKNFFMLYIFFGVGSQESKNVSDGVKRNNDYKIRQGIYPGRSPLGYMFDSNKLKGQKDHIPNPRNWNKCREWIELVLKENLTVEKSLEIMTAKGLLDNKGGQVSKTKAYEFFKDIFYTGLFKSKDKRYQGIHQPLMTMAEYQKIQKIIGARRHDQDWNNPLWFQGSVIQCQCGAYITGEKHTKKYRNGESQQFHYARCSKKKGPCRESYLPIEKTKDINGLNNQVKNYLDEMTVAQEYIDLIRKILLRRNKQEFQRSAKDRELQTKRLAELDKQKESLYGMKAEGFYDNNPGEYEKKKTDLLKQELLVKQEIMPDSTAYWRTLLEDTTDFVLKMKRLFENGDSYTRQMILKILGSNLTLKDRKLQIEAKTAFIAIKGVQKEVENLTGWLEPNATHKPGTTSNFTPLQYTECNLVRITNATI